MELIYGQENNSLRHLPLFGLKGFVNSNLANKPKDYKLVIGYCFYFNNTVIFWSIKKQKTVFI